MKYWKEIFVGDEIKIHHYPEEDEDDYDEHKHSLIEAVIVDAEISHGSILTIKTLDKNGRLEQKTIYELANTFVQIFYKQDCDIRRIRSQHYSAIPFIFPVVGDYFNPVTPCKRIPTTKVIEISCNNYRFEGDFRWFNLSGINVLRLPYPERLKF